MDFGEIAKTSKTESQTQRTENIQKSKNAICTPRMHSDAFRNWAKHSRILGSRRITVFFANTGKTRFFGQVGARPNHVFYDVFWGRRNIRVLRLLGSQGFLKPCFLRCTRLQGCRKQRKNQCFWHRSRSRRRKIRVFLRCQKTLKNTWFACPPTCRIQRVLPVFGKNTVTLLEPRILEFRPKFKNSWDSFSDRR